MPTPPSAAGAAAGAEVLLNLSASNIVIGKAQMRRLLCASQSARCIAAYAYSAAGAGESTTDLAWDGQAGIFEIGEDLAETERFSAAAEIAIADVDLGRIRQERMRTNTFGDSARLALAAVPPFRRIEFDFAAPVGAAGAAPPDRALSVRALRPGDAGRQLLRGLQHPGAGAGATIEGDRSRKAGDRGLGRARFDPGADRLGPGRWTGSVCRAAISWPIPCRASPPAIETKANAWRLMKALGVTGGEIDIRPAASQMFADIGHPTAKGEPLYDVTFENVQAGLRTDYLFRLANHNGALVVGTGDLSELALGWCTYGVGDHMSHYNPNASVAKTLVQHLIRFVAASGDVSAETAGVLADILATEISPELVPAGADGAIQSTESIVGPYALAGFQPVLRDALRLSAVEDRLSRLECLARCRSRAGGRPTPRPMPGAPSIFAEIKNWLRVFLKRFFEQSQFKRSALPNGPKISSGGSLSPRGDWRAPSDSHAAVWLAELEESVPDKE